MATLRPRTRVVYFRISEPEYERYVAACAEHGAASLSDFARIAVRHLLECRGSGSLEGRLRAIEDRLERISPAIEGSRSESPVKS